MEKYVKKLKFIEEYMIHNHGVKSDFYDIIMENRPIEMVVNEDDKYGKYAIKMIIDPSTTMSYSYKKREHRDNDFEELTRCKKIYNELS